MISYGTAVQILYDCGCAQNVIEHCLAVSSLSVRTAEKLSGSGINVNANVNININININVNVELVKIGSVLHDLGRSRTHAIDHAVVGARMAEELGLDARIVQIIKCHIGGGISGTEAKCLGLPDDNYIPVTIEEKIVAHCDNLMRGTERISIDECILRMRSCNMSKESIDRVKTLANEVGVC
ncbi:MAG TPA: HDIG domain-containing protein [Methanosarcinaceae archaeon]|nr:HDIG domain-containing protein [Methanosarcinaceae archaeon]